ncbi:MAG: hypothetical protein JWN61_3000 [Pseudonocardiales bacterium]|nr:hypothetical protein [Jatrophihabitantaceae bacterium]MCW2604865.1 hypothetical protein [Pseudonocardiales bacterium]
MPRFAEGEGAGAASVPAMGWQFWLAAPLLVTMSAAVLVWWQARPRATPSVHIRVRDHHRFLDELGRHSGGGDIAPTSVVIAADQPAPQA